MAKTKSSTGTNNKTNFGRRKGGRAEKFSGPKDKNKKPYIGQGKKH